MGNLIKFPKRVLKTNIVYCADNLEVMKQLPSESIHFCYIDPPFNTGTIRKSKAWDKEVQIGNFDDRWGGGLSSYVHWLSLRIREIRRLLKPTGSIAVHLDYNSVHHVKVEMDKIFGDGQIDRGSKHLINEIIWCYKSGGASKKSFAKKHDTILIYSKTKKYIFNLKKEKTYRNKSGAPIGRQKYFYDEGGKYTFVCPKDYWNIPMLYRSGLKIDEKSRIRVLVEKNITVQGSTILIQF